ncbi:MAG: hypothetical protein ACJ76N_26085 [Thermoanaerobaculia bacterium]
MAVALEEADGGPAIDSLGLPEGLQADLAHFEDATDALLQRQLAKASRSSRRRSSATDLMEEV